GTSAESEMGVQTIPDEGIQRRRLEECRRMLARRDAAGITVAGVAHRWGFSSASHFGRVFRTAYGVSPADWRDSAAPARTARALRPEEAREPRRPAA
ncbi:helix-turn-helix domain-containing protein, partial [Streptomyces sp. NPDC006324]|uniref:helix-turn-helix domain-containing protein n=1 Tax=Streptomyces sp. NPDC006324 TaxID=3156751 RepID=UPI0033B4C21A